MDPNSAMAFSIGSSRIFGRSPIPTKWTARPRPAGALAKPRPTWRHSAPCASCNQKTEWPPGPSNPPWPAGRAGRPEISTSQTRACFLRDELHALLSEGSGRRRRTTINAHYTSARYPAVWSAVTTRLCWWRCSNRGVVRVTSSVSPPRIVQSPALSLTGDPSIAPRSTQRQPSGQRALPTPPADGAWTGDRQRAVGKITLHDRAHNAGGHRSTTTSLSRVSTHPGRWMVAVVTSRFTLDAQSDAARREMAERRLLGAIRLPAEPSGRRRARCRDDIVFLRKRAPDEAHAGAAWLSLRPVATVDGEVLVNEYFATRPEMIIGELRRSRPVGADDLDVVADPDKTMAGCGGHRFAQRRCWPHV